MPEEIRPVFKVLLAVIVFLAVFAVILRVQLTPPNAEQTVATPSMTIAPIPSDPKRQAAEQWLINNSGGTIQKMTPAPDWQKGPRMNVILTNGEALLFYFNAGNKLCGVWRVRPREQLYRDQSC